MEPVFLTWFKTQVSAMFPRAFPGIETTSSWDLCPACQGQGRGGLETARGTLGQPKEFIGRLGVFVMSLWLCWFIQFDLLNPKPQPLHDQYADAKHHYDHANPKMAFPFARAATCPLSQHGHRNLDREGTKINIARMRCGDCHENKVSGKFQKFIRFYLEMFLLLFCSADAILTKSYAAASEKLQRNIEKAALQESAAFLQRPC